MTYLLRLSACLFLCVSLNSFGALYDRGNGLIYDDVLDITWLQDANYAQTSGYDSDGRMTWDESKIWTNNLVYEGFENWRLPSVGDSPNTGYNQTSSELGHMFYLNLSVLAGNSILSNLSFNDSLSGKAQSFQNVQEYPYWYLEEYAPITDRAWAFVTSDGIQNYDGKNNVSRYAWAVHDGDIGASPVPLPAGIYLFLSGLVGLGLMRGRNA